MVMPWTVVKKNVYNGFMFSRQEYDMKEYEVGQLMKRMLKFKQGCI